ncbi:MULTISPECIES: PAS domain-containing sensor histidine kinase [Cytobacillus]|uniref:histidine kinase n=1 Tax=Cytobacillus firmus TaxID=1399 RepID=A0AA46SKK5_CYTFI|nr:MULTISPECIES: PAS domain-containing sensor histidine kinase [Cytobacillus]KML46294.1 histidine kinase [Cytobacillus firmus]MCC3645458.1 two-component sensor histidine kinase [Cytobacillus oceanisediminis]MCU1804720.1 ATP-binding protein [Cytobacillus firmus]UYG96605.1 ATP-binding protein [Cytobacillus firmus]WHY35686.1 ATP-binding protein [Cytobacillus firmus]
MNNRNRNFLLYLFAVIIPTLAGSIFLFMDSVKQNDMERLEEAKWIGSIHQRSWDQFISETVTTLEMLSLTAGSADTPSEKLEPLLQKANQMDPRYGGIYLLDPSGMVLTGSNQFLANSDLSEKKFLKEILVTKDIVISNTPETLTNGQTVVGIGKPVLNDDGDVISIIVAHMRVDYVQNIMRLLTPDARLSVLNSKRKTIMDINMNGDSSFSSQNSITIPIDRLPWSVKVEFPPRDMLKIIKDAFRAILVLTIIIHILFLFIKYLRLKKQAEKEKKENELQKIELVGTLAASTAHEIRNPLTGIKGLIQLLSEKYTNTHDQYYFSVINDEISRINEIVSEFLILGKPTAQKMEAMDLRSVIKELEPLILSEANLHNVTFESVFSDEPVIVDCTKDQMKQVILNLTKNAFESMQGGGKLTIKLNKLQSKCQLKIADTGSGIPEDKIEQIFHPFYTSKEMGTGLGLVVCRRIVHSFGGEIFITSEETKGTHVDIFLPIKNP